MARSFLFFYLLLPFFSAAQVVDTSQTQVVVDSLIQLSRKLVVQSKFQDALQVNEMADSIALVAFGENHPLYAQCLFKHGGTYFLLAEYKDAEPLWLESLAIRGKLLGKEHSDYVYSLNNLAILYLKMGDYEKAEPMFLEVKAIREKVLGKGHPDYAAALNNLALHYQKKGDYDKAEPLFLESFAIRKKVLEKEHPDYTMSLNNLAVLFIEKGEYDKAEPLLLESLAIREEVLGEEHPVYARGLNNLALLYFYKGEYDKAESMFLEALAIREKVWGKEHLEYAESLHGLANLYWMIAEYDKAELLYLKTQAIHEKVLGKEHPEYALSLSGLANLYLIKGEYDKAKSLYLEILSIREKVLGKEHPDYIAALNNLASLYKKKGDYNQSELMLLEFITVREKTLGKQHPDYASSLAGLASIYSNKGDYDKAEPLYIEARAILEKAVGKEHIYYADCLVELAALYFRKREYDKAEPLFLESNSIYKKIFGKEHPDYAKSLYLLATYYRATEEFQKSEAYFNESSSITNRILQKSATYLPRQELEKFIALYQGCNEAFYSFNHQTTSIPFRIASYNTALFYKGFVLETATRLEQTMQTAPDSIRDVHARWKGYNRLLAAEIAKPVTARKNVVYLDSISTVLEKELLRSASEFAEAQRQVEWQDVRDALQKGEAAIEFIQYRYADNQTTDSTMYSALVTLPGQVAPQFIPLCEARQIEALFYKANGSRANYLSNLYASPRADGLASLNQLIWSPIEKTLREMGVTKVYYAPTGLLHRLNLAAISEGKSGIPLAAKYHLVPLSSTRSLAVRKNEGYLVNEATPEAATHHPALSRGLGADSTPNSAIIYGGVRYEMDSAAIAIANAALKATAQDTTGRQFGFAYKTEAQRSDTWNPLPGTEKEARYLDSLLRSRGINTSLRIGYQATEESFKQIGQNSLSPSLLHIGTHGFFFPDPQDTTRRRASLNSDEPVFKISEYSMIRSGLKLAGSRYAWENGHPLPGGHEDGILTAYEVSQMNLSNTQLVVLSACETGLGDIRGNEGVYGLQRAFRIAGAKNVLMSLWKVPDVATEKLMTRFYHNWLEEKKPLRESFDGAQLWLRGQAGFENPYYWAGFVLVE